MQEKQFIQKGARKVRLDEFLSDELEGAGYSRSEIQRTPTSTKIVVHAQKPGLVIGRGGSRIRELTEKMEGEFDFENPQIEVNEIENADADAVVAAKSIANWLEKGGHAKRVGYTYVRRIKEAGAIGAEIEITGKLSGNRGRTEKFSFGYVKRCGNTSKDNVQKGYKLARTKPGAIGVKVRIMKEMPDFLHRDVDVNKEILHETVEEEGESKEIRIEKVLGKAENMTSAGIETAIEESGMNTDDISRDEVRDAFEAMDEDLEDIRERIQETDEVEESDSEDGAKEEVEETEETEESPEETDSEESEDESESEDDSEEVEEDQEEADVDFDEVVSGTISDAKETISEMEDPDFDALLDAEEDNKDRKTFKEWLERQKD